MLLAACAPPAPSLPTAPVTRAAIVSHGELVSRLAAHGFTITPVESGESLACNARGACVCLSELACGNDCITLAHNLEVFEAARRGEDERSVTCELADTGKLCDTSYFRFEGDIYRWEDRYYDASGRLIGQKNATDDDEYCGGKTNVRFMGAVPDCREHARDVHLICSDGHTDRTPLGNPMDRLLGSLAP